MKWKFGWINWLSCYVRSTKSETLWRLWEITVRLLACHRCVAWDNLSFFLFCGRTILAALMAVNCRVLKYLTSVHIISCALNSCTAHWKMQNMIFLEDPIVYLFSFKLHIWHVSNVNSVWRCTLFSPLCTPMGSWYPEILPFFSLICKGHSYVIWMIRNLIHCIWKGEINWNKLFHPW